VQDDRVTVTDLLQALEACDPDAAVRLPPARLAVPVRHRPTNAAVGSSWIAPRWCPSAKAPSSAPSPNPSARSSAGSHPD
jgi:hypothetical protein